MSIHRRRLIQQGLFTVAGVLVLPACLQDRSKSSILLNQIHVSADQEKTLGDLAEAILPKTETPGARDISAHLFALRMVDDCLGPEEQERFMLGMTSFEQQVREQMGKSFSSCSEKERVEVLNKILGTGKSEEPAAAFVGNFKRLVVQAYMSSRFYLEKIQVYELVPARYHGCVPV